MNRCPFHLRALVTASVHFLVCGVFGATVLFLAVTDVLANPAEGPVPWWLSVSYWALMVLNAPMASFFGLLDGSQMMHLPALLLAACWSMLVGYAVSLIWRRIEKSIEAKHEQKSMPV